MLTYSEANRNQRIIKIESEEEDEGYPDIQTINAFKSTYPEIKDTVVLPILVGQIGNL